MSNQLEQKNTDLTNVTRREFVSSAAALGTGLVVASKPMKSLAESAKKEDLNVAVIGFGSQGKVLMDAMLQIPSGVRFKAICDVWPYKQKYAQRYLQKFKHDVNVYTDYQDMLDSEKDLDCVIVASPDFVHADHTNAALRAGCHVYCEKLMSNTVEGARSMVLTQRETGKLLQIGHQRRSNPRYIHAKEKLIDEANLCGRITTINGQWNRAVKEDDTWPKKYEIDQSTLDKYGYANMFEFRNWRWFKQYGGGPISDLGAHQIDIYNWFLDANPQSIIAGGGVDFYDKHEWYDNVMAIYEYEGKLGKTRAFYQVQTTTSAGGGYYEYFMGTGGAIKISENPKYTQVFQEAGADWAEWIDKGYIKQGASGGGGGYNPLAPKPWDKPKGGSGKVDVRETAALVSWDIPVDLGNKKIHQFHLENFFDSVRGETALNCPADKAFASSVMILAANEAVGAQKMLKFEPSEFIA
ncbi:MAG: Gfo/Idh/MocA family oxidoreductase [Verrucomicrobiota bacterium]